MMEKELQASEMRLTLLEMHRLSSSASEYRERAENKVESIVAKNQDAQAEVTPSKASANDVDIDKVTLSKAEQRLNALPVSFNSCYYPCWVISLSRLCKLDKIIKHEEAMKAGLLEELTAYSKSPSCAHSYFVSQNWESEESPDNALNTKLEWLKNMRDHFNLKADTEVWIWWDLISIPQAKVNRPHMIRSIKSLCYYASICSRFIPLVRDEAEWLALYGKEHPSSKMLPRGTLSTYLSRGWCRLELVAALSPKKWTSSGRFRPGPINMRFRYHSNPEDPGLGPLLSEEHLLDPREGDFKKEDDKKKIQAVLEAIGARYTEYEVSGSSNWDHTVDVTKRPKWLKDLGKKSNRTWCYTFKTALNDQEKIRPSTGTTDSYDEKDNSMNAEEAKEGKTSQGTQRGGKLYLPPLVSETKEPGISV